MKQKGIYSLLLLGTLLFCGCDNKNESTIRNADWKKAEALLLHSEKQAVRHNTDSFYYFDTDGNPETAEAMLHLISPSEKTHLRYFNNAKIGTYRTLEEWENTLSGKHDYIQWTATHLKKSKISRGYYKEKE